MARQSSAAELMLLDLLRLASGAQHNMELYARLSLQQVSAGAGSGPAAGSQQAAAAAAAAAAGDQPRLSLAHRQQLHQQPTANHQLARQQFKPLDLTLARARRAAASNSGPTSAKQQLGERLDAVAAAAAAVAAANKLISSSTWPASSDSSSPSSTDWPGSCESSATQGDIVISSSAAATNGASSAAAAAAAPKAGPGTSSSAAASSTSPELANQHAPEVGRATAEERRRQKQKAAKSHLCLDCGRSFSRSDMLTRHSRLHSGLKPYQCAECKQVFSRSDHLSTHERTHTGEKPYQCERCAYSACRRDMITRHMRIHADQAAKRKSVTVRCRLRLSRKQAARIERAARRQVFEHHDDQLRHTHDELSTTSPDDEHVHEHQHEDDDDDDDLDQDDDEAQMHERQPSPILQLAATQSQQHFEPAGHEALAMTQHTSG